MAKTMGSGEKCAGVMVATEARKHRGIPKKKFVMLCLCGKYPFSEGKNVLE